MPDQTDATTPGTTPEPTTSADESAAPKRRRRAVSRPAGSPATGTPDVTAPSADVPAAGDEPPAPARRRRTATRAAGADDATAAAAADEAAEPAPKRRRTATRAAGSPTAGGDEAPATGDGTAAPARRRRTASRPAGADAPGDTDTDTTDTTAASTESGTADEAPAPKRRRVSRAAGSAGTAASAAEDVPAAAATTTSDSDEPAAPAARRRRAASRPAGSPEAAGEGVSVEAAVGGDAVEEASAPKRRRAASRPAGSPAVGAGEETPADAGAVAVEESAAPAARRRRAASRPAGSPAVGAGEETPAGVEAVATAVAETDDVQEPASGTRTRRRATRKAAAPAPAAVPAESRPADEAAPAGDAAAPAGESRRRGRGRKGDAVATFSAGDGSRRLKPGALAPKDEQEDEGATRMYTGRAFQDGDGWAVEIDDAYEIRGYGETPEEAAAEAVAAVAEAFGVPAQSVRIEVRTEEETEPTARGGRRRAARPALAVFQPPVFQAPQAAAVPAEEGAGDDEAAEAEDDRTPRRRRRRRGGAVEQIATPAEEAEVESAEDSEAEAGAEPDEDGSDGEDRPSRRRRRGGRRRRRGESADHEHDDSASGEDDEESHEDEESDSGEEADEDGGADEASSTTSRRRRRRRRRGSDASAEDGAVDDPERTVVKVREPRSKYEGGTGADEVQSIKGSTRLEAKKQRRREGREQGRRRVPIITEAEFLARREAVERVMVVRQNGDRTQIGVLEDNVLVEHYVNKEQSTSYVGNVYLGKVQNVLPSMEAAFVDIGKGRNAVLYAGEVNFEALGLSGGPRRIESALKSGQSVLVQVTKDPIGHKGARLTSQVSLPGRYLVYVPEGSMTGISRKLPDTERARLKTILKKIVPEDAGVIVRTAAEGASEEELRRDVARLQAQWEDIQNKAKNGGGGNAPALLYGEPDMTVRVVRDIFNEDFSKVIVSGDEAWSTVHEYVSHVAPDLADRLSRWSSEVDVFATHRIDEQLLKALDRKVWLPSGGSLVIDKTEAMVVVDVNTGKFTGQGGNLEETVTRNNLEAAEEIVRQLRLRDLGGIVVIDFIDMVLESNRDLVMRRLLECLGRDRTKHQVAEVTSLGLVQMTRKRVGQGLLESFSETCVHCNGRGVIVHMDQATTTGGGGKRKRRSARGAGEHVHEVEVEVEAEEAVAETDELPELEPIEVGESELVPSVGDPEEEWFGSAAEAEAAAASARGRGRRRGARKATAPEGAPAAGSVPEPAVVVVPVSEPDVEPQLEAELPAVSTEPPARTRRRATREVTAPAGSPASAEDAAVVVVAAEPVAPAQPEPEAELPAVSTEPPARTRRRATRKVAAPAGSPASAEDAAVVVVPGAAAAGEEEAGAAAEAEPEPAKRAARKTAAKKTAAKKTAKKAATKKAAAKKATTRKAAASAE
jgi:ribonuclease E